MPSETNLANVALALIAHAEISSIDETTNDIAKTVKTLYPVARDATLRAAHWNSATWRQTLGEVGTYEQHDFAHVYQLPQNPFCLKARRFETLNVKTTTRFHPGQRPFRVEGRFILTDVETPTLIYTRRLEDVNSMDAMLYQTIATLLGAHLALAITQNYKRHSELFGAWVAMKDEANGVDEAEGGRDEYTSFDLLTNR
jgi:hypothetical protein